MTNKPTTTIRIDMDDKQKANKVFKEIGISLSTAVNTFLRAVIREGKIPFELTSSSKNHNSNAKNTDLNHAFVNKKDEFYTMYEDVEKEMILHKTQFEGKTVLCNCDDPFESAFFRYFVVNFNELKLGRLISTCYKHSSFPDDRAKRKGAYKAVINQVPTEAIHRECSSADLSKLFRNPENRLEDLAGDGDFRSQECEELLRQSDIVATNPPFSLFREYISLLIRNDKHFIVLGNINASTCKEIFPLFRDNKVWYGESITSGDRKFFVPDDYPLNASSCGVDKEGRKYIRVKGVRWFSNLDTPGRHTPLPLKEKYDVEWNPRYENYDAIDVGRTQRIPKDYMGIMGVPITFLDKYCPDQFRILMLANGNTRTNSSPEALSEVGYTRHPDDKGGVGIIDGKRAYARIMIQRKANE